MDEILGKLREARALLLEACNDKPDSLSCTLTLTKINEAILWRQEDMRLKEPTVNECSD